MTLRWSGQWGGWIAMTPPWLPVAGRARRSVSCLIACNGHGLAQALYLGTLLADRVDGDKAHDDLVIVWRERPRFGPLLAFNASVTHAMWALERAKELSGTNNLINNACPGCVATDPARPIGPGLGRKRRRRRAMTPGDGPVLTALSTTRT
ncbi:hypothetical protein ACIHCV_27535 [Streptomyces sp. NPDC051956]|uniref:hypothetical protein n=1 Tax=Streptomyces sp. NPDC051956 TaxID=3365677 RepID=UPI0037CD9CEC